MKISYTDHALERLSERNVSKKQVEKALISGEKNDINGDLRQAEVKIDNQILIVRYNIKSTKEVLVVTLFWKD